MSKKDFKGGLGSLLQSTTGKMVSSSAHEQPPIPIEESMPTHAEPEEKRATFIVRVDLLDKINAIAYWERTLLKDQVNQAFADYVDAYEKKNGIVKLPPKK